MSRFRSIALIFFTCVVGCDEPAKTSRMVPVVDSAPSTSAEDAKAVTKAPKRIATH